MGKGRPFSPFEDEVIATIGLKYEDKVIAKVLGRSKNSINSRRLLLGFRKLPLYYRETELKSYAKTHTALGNPSNYWENEDDIEQALTPKYNIKDLEGDELEILNKFK